MSIKGKDSGLTRVYEEKGAAEVALYGNSGLFIGQDYWIAEQVKEAKKILDVGCGTGRMGKLINAELFGVDVSSSLVNEARKNGYIKAVACELGNSKLPFEDGFFDAVICLDVLEHLVDPVQTLAEINRVLKPEGLLGITTPNIAFAVCRLALLLGHFTDTWEVALPSPHIRHYTFNSLERMLVQGGFKKVKVEGYPIGDWRQRKFALWRYLLHCLAGVRPQIFAREIVLLACKTGEPMQKYWQEPPVGSINGLSRVKNLWRIT
jgi:SAM-dependent methyltransferase